MSRSNCSALAGYCAGCDWCQVKSCLFGDGGGGAVRLAEFGVSIVFGGGWWYSTVLTRIDGSRSDDSASVGCGTGCNWWQGKNCLFGKGGSGTAQWVAFDVSSVYGGAFAERLLVVCGDLVR